MKTIIRIFSTPLFIVYFTLLSAIVIALLVFAKYLEHGGPLRRYNERTAGGGGREASIVGDYSANASPLINGAGGLVQEPGSSSSAVVVAAAAAASTHLLLDSSLNSSSGGVTMGAMRFRSSSMSSSVTSPLLGSNNYSTTNDTIRFFESRRWRRFRRGLRRRLRKVNLSNLLGNLYSIMGGASASESLIFVRSG